VNAAAAMPPLFVRHAGGRECPGWERLVFQEEVFVKSPELPFRMGYGNF
jgi:hypothetical protein